MPRATTTKPAAKRTPAKKTTKKPTKKLPFSNNRYLKKILLAVAICVFGFVGAYLIRNPFALDPNGVPTDQNQLVVQIREAHPHADAVDVLPEYHPPSMLLYGDGVIICGGHADNKKDNYSIKTGRLNSNQIDDVVARITKHGAKSKEEQDHTKKLSKEHPIELADQILVNYNVGAVSIRGVDGDTTAAFKNIHGVLTSTCAKYAKNDFRADQYVVRSQAVDPATVADLPEVPATATAVAADGSYTEATVDTAQAEAVIAAMNGARNAKLTANDKVYEVEVNPVMPFHTPIAPEATVDPDTVSAKSDLKTQFIWFHPENESRAGFSDRLDNIHGSARNFFEQETGRLNSTAGNTFVRGNHSVSWYNACHSDIGISCGSSKDLNAFYNVRKELENRGIIPKDTATTDMNLSVNVLAQWSSQHGSGYCSGWGSAPASPAVSKGGFALTTGFNTSTGGCNASNSKFVVPAHEMGHTFGLSHDCSSSPNNALMCHSGRYSWPTGYTLISTQKAPLKANSLFLNHQVTGRVYYQETGKPAAGLAVTTCRSDVTGIKTGTTGYFGFRLLTEGSYCLRITAPAGYKIVTKNNPEYATRTTYEYQRVGRNCYRQTVDTICSIYYTTHDMASDSGKDFILVKL